MTSDPTLKTTDAAATAASFAWQNLAAHRDRIQASTLRTLFEADEGRFARYSAEAAGLLLDYSKNLIDDEVLGALLQLARECGVEQRRDAMFAGEKINLTERRAVLHTALRAPPGSVVLLDGKDVMPDVHDALERVCSFAESVRNGTWRGYSGSTIRDVVHIGIGGSDLGPRTVCDALSEYRHERLRLHFVANVDAHDLLRTLRDLDASSTLFIIASKTFTTLETMMNAHTARAWCIAQGVPESALHQHFAAVSTNGPGVKAFGIDVANMFPFWDWVGGRFSLWSAIGVPIALQCGAERFKELLAGAHAMDRHFAEAPLESNLPVLLGLIGVWNTNLLGLHTLSIAPYYQGLAMLPSHLQQVEMESNGKSVTREGLPLPRPAVPVIWGQAGTNGQHAYFQWLHQSADVACVDFIAVLEAHHGNVAHQRALLANCFAQSEALLRGKTEDEAYREMLAAGVADATARELAPHKVFPGNRPSCTIVLPRLDPHSLGALIALYEHKVVVQGTLWNVNSFDQWGVEWGKVLAGRIIEELEEGTVGQHDCSTRGLIALVKQRLQA